MEEQLCTSNQQHCGAGWRRRPEPERLRGGADTQGHVGDMPHASCGAGGTENRQLFGIRPKHAMAARVTAVSGISSAQEGSRARGQKARRSDSQPSLAPLA